MISAPTANSKRKLYIFPLMDMFFMLLIFFFMIQGGATPTKLEIGLPKKIDYGEANAIIQVITANSYIWLDSTCIGKYNPVQPAALLESRLDSTGLRSKIDQARDSRASRFLILVRCPNSIDYGVVHQITRLIVGAEMEQGQKNQRMLMSFIAGEPSAVRFAKGTADDGREYLQVTFTD
jgi:biopolymer transport protein ExbD